MTLINGIPADVVPANDRGLLYGDGVFRTLTRAGGKSRCWSRQYVKLAADCAVLGLRCPDAATLEAELAQLPPDCVAKIIITRGAGMRGYALTAGAEPTRIVTASALPVYPECYFTEGVKMHLCALRLSSQPRLAGVKHLNRLENVLARMEWSDPVIAEGLLLDEAGKVIEGCMSNVFACSQGVLHTPELKRCGVAGVQRGRILDFAAELGLAAQVGPLTLEALMAADEVMLCNSVIGVWQVSEFNGRSWAVGSVSAQLRRLLDGRDD